MENTFLTNYSEKTFLDKLKEAFEKCTSFSLSVSFIKKPGLALVEKYIEEALKRGVNGRIITSTYQNFTDVASLKTFYNWMNIYPNFDCHLDFDCFGSDGFHSKGYLFEYEDSHEFIVGSTNITRFALLKNIEWNVSLKSDKKFDSAQRAYIEYFDLWSKTKKLDSDLISMYKDRLEVAVDRWDMDFVDPVSEVIKPNAMQRVALKELRRYRDMGVSKALVVAATGSGKTYLAAFDARNYDAKRVLFVVHRDKILSDARDTFQKVFGSNKSYGLYVGKNKETDCDFVFASNMMLSKNLSEFDPHEFDYIVMDECHHTAADTYRKIMGYFKPGFYLGITATPERMDNQDTFALFDKNVPYELRLKDAITNDLVVPFHYYGVRDKLVDYGYKEKNKISKEIAKIENIEFIKNEIEKHKPIGKLKALAFCNSVQHAQFMSEQLNEVGYNAIALNGSNDLGQRIKAFNDLQNDKNPLEIICTVDILNEGVDIPSVNMVLFLRPTESSTIFLQQLGRGLRKYEGKQYVTVLDFIGNNYDRSIQIAMALGSLGNSTVIEKPLLMQLVRTDFNALNIPGVVVNIDSLSKEEIIDFIKNTNFNRRDFLKKDYENFKKYLKIESYPSHNDFLNNDCAPDLMRLMKAHMGSKKNKSYYNFLKKIEEKDIPDFTPEQISFIDDVSELLPLVRVDEYLILNQLLNENRVDINKLVDYSPKVTKETLSHALKMLVKDDILLHDEGYKFNIDSVSNEFKKYMDDLLSYGLQRFEAEFGEFEGVFKQYSNYYKEQIMRVLLKPSLMFQKGTMFEKNNETYLFVGLKKDKDKIEKTNYKDKFLSPDIFQWESENNTTIDNATGRKLLLTKKVHLFVRKMDEEDGITLPFTYVGTGVLTNMRKSHVDTKKDDGNVVAVPTLLYDVKLDDPVKEDYWFDFEIPNEGK